MSPDFEAALYGREQQTDLLRTAMRLAKSAKAQTLRFVGEPGSGKTSLLRWIAREASGFTLLRAVSVETEAHLPFAALAPIVDRLSGVVELLGEGHRHALAQSLGWENDPTHGRVSSLAMGAATLSLLTLAAEKQPVVLLLDDVHWMDQPSAAALSFAVRRFEDDRIVTVVAVREGESTAFDDVGLVVPVDPLALSAVLELLESRGVAGAAARDVWSITGGNPLAIEALVESLDHEQRAGTTALPASVRSPRRLASWLDRRLDGLSPSAREALLLAAVDDLGGTASITAAHVASGGSPADLEESEAAGVIRLDGGLTFAHPLFRSAVIEAASRAEVRGAHRALAEALAPAAAFDDRLAASRAWHLATSATGHDGTAANELAKFAERAIERGANEPAARAFERAARLDPEPGRRTELLLQSVETWSRAGNLDIVRRLLVEAEALELSDQQATVLAHLHCNAHAWVDSEAALLAPARRARAIEDSEPEQALGLWFTVGVYAVFAASPRYIVEAQQRIPALASRAVGALRVAAPVMVACLQLLGGEGRTAEPTLAFVDLTVPSFVAAGRLLDDGELAFLQVIGVTQLVRARWDHAERTLRAVAAHARARGAAVQHTFAFALLGELYWRTGRYAEAISHALVDVESSGSALRPASGFGYSTLARVHACLGQLDEAESLARAAVEAGRRIAMPTMEMWGLAALGFVQHLAGRQSEAIGSFEAMLQCEQRGGTPHPSVFWWQVDLLELYALVGHRAGLERLRERASGDAARNVHEWADLVVHRVEAELCETDEAAVLHLDAAIVSAERLGAPLEVARVLLARARRLASRGAGEPDRTRAYELLRGIGASVLLSDSSAGPAASVEDPHGNWMAKLSKAELRVAMVVGRGMSDREAADELYLSAKTVDAHLRSVFRKLGIRSRAELANLVGRSNT